MMRIILILSIISAIIFIYWAWVVYPKKKYVKVINTLTNQRFTSAQDAAKYLGKEVTYFGVEEPNKTGILLSVTYKGILTIGDWTCHYNYWNCKPKS